MKKRYPPIDITDRKYKIVLICSYCVIVAIVMAIVFTSIFFWFGKYTKRVIGDMASIQLDNLDNSISRRVESYKQQLLNVWHEPNIKISLYSTEQNYETEYKISRFLGSMTANNSTAKYFGVFSSRKDIKYYGNTYPDEVERTSIENHVFKSTKDDEQLIIEKENNRYLCLMLTERGRFRGTPERGLIFVLDLGELRKTILYDKSGEYDFLVFCSDYSLLFHSELPEQTIARIQAMLKEQNYTYGSEEVQIDKTPYMINTKKNETSGFFSVMVRDIHLIQDETSEVKKAMYLPSVAITLLVVLFSIFMANQIYHQLQAVFRKILSGSDITRIDDEYSKMQTEYTSEKIMSRINSLTEQYYSSIVLDYLRSTEETDNPPKELRLTDRQEHCRFVLCWTDREFYPGRLPKIMTEHMENVFSGSKIRSYIVENKPWFLIVLKEPERLNSLMDQKKLTVHLENIIHQLEVELHITLYAGISNVLWKESELQPAYKELKVMIKLLLFDNCSTVMNQKKLYSETNTILPRTTMENVLSQVYKGRHKEASLMIHNLLEELKPHNVKKSILLLAELASRLKGNILNEELTGRQQQEYYLDYYMKISALHTRKELETYLEQLIIDAGLENSLLLEKRMRLDMLDAINYLKEHYRESDICVEKVAERFGISVSYFSRAFNEYVGTTFPEYIKDMRLAYAYELLRSNTTMKVNKIAEVSGFNSNSYFSSQFKKKYGVSPSVVREQKEK